MKNSKFIKTIPHSLVLLGFGLISTHTSADIIHADDVIINGGSLCVGFDCVNGESFSFDTIRMKENNLRLHFDDTSTSASFPPNDWRFIANDSANGGDSYMAIEDATAGRQVFRVQAGARSNALFVDSQGDVGIGTSTPATDIDIKTGNTPTVRLQQDGSSGFSSQTWDVAGNEANFFIRDATNGSTLPFRLRPGAPSSSIDIEGTTGDIGVGTSSPEAPIHVRRTNGTAKILVEDTSTAIVQRTLAEVINKGGVMMNYIDTNAEKEWRTGVFRAGTTFLIKQDGTLGAGNFEFLSDGTNASLGIGIAPLHPIHHSSGARLTSGGVWADSSSRTRKKNIRELGVKEAIEAVRSLSPVKYQYKIDESEEYAGFIAEDVPDLVAMKDRDGLSPMDIVAVLTKVVKEQDKVIEEMKTRLVKLEKADY